jgi:hypothetical protein
VAFLNRNGAIDFLDLNACISTQFFEGIFVDTICFLLGSNRGKVAGGAGMLTGVVLNAAELHIRQIALDYFNVSWYGSEHRLLQLPSKLEAARPKDMNISAIDQQIEVVV